jgi:hypothetical protein
MKVKLLSKDNCIELLKFESDSVLRDIYNQSTFDNSKLIYLNSPSPFSIDESLVLGTLPKDDFENSKKIFAAFKNLDKTQANDKRLWVALTHSIFFSYTKERWNIDEKTSGDTIISRFHFEGAGLETRMRNSISRLWWAAKITYDENRDNKFELTELLLEKQDIITSLVERSYGTYKNVLHGFLEFYRSNKHLKENDIRTLAKGLNSIGGVKVLPIVKQDLIPSELKKIAKFNRIDVNEVSL